MLPLPYLRIIIREDGSSEITVNKRVYENQEVYSQIDELDCSDTSSAALIPQIQAMEFPGGFLRVKLPDQEREFLLMTFEFDGG